MSDTKVRYHKGYDAFSQDFYKAITKGKQKTQPAPRRAALNPFCFSSGDSALIPFRAAAAQYSHDDVR